MSDGFLPLEKPHYNEASKKAMNNSFAKELIKNYILWVSWYFTPRHSPIIKDFSTALVISLFLIKIKFR